MLYLRVFFIYIFALSVSYADIIRTNDLKVIQKEIFSLPKDTLIVFDVDFVLITPSDEAFIMQATEEGEKFIKRMHKELFKRYTVDHVNHLQSIIMNNQSWRLVTPETSNIFNQIKNKGYQTIGLTACMTGAFGIIPLVEDWRIEQLRKLDITFSNTFIDVKARVLDQYIPEICENYRNSLFPSFPTVKNGIIFSTSIPKGKVFSAYLKHCDIKPNKVIFIDDRLNNLESVQEYCQETGIEFIGYEYTAMKEQANCIALNKRRSRLQGKVLELTQTWIDDKQADEIISTIAE